MLEQQYNEIKAMVGKDQIRDPTCTKYPILLSSDQPYFCLRVKEETSMGLPCAHIIRTLITNNQNGRLSSLQNPLVPRTRGRPVGARNNVRSQSSTQRDLSAFELAEQGTTLGDAVYVVNWSQQ
ncbi:hypothetical protein BASA60_003920 [Batrachochytrium salamandrivorans]|nr:hypothetical protein BASA60_003920 [Batrachochytrium salamandrivorans]